MDQLSGGERTMAALALLFSIHSFRPAPFFVLDEVDAALDNSNVKKIRDYMQRRSRDFQCIVITLKDTFFEYADSLVGICKDVNSLSSRVLTLDLTQYDTGSPSGSDASSPHRNGPGEASNLAGERDSGLLEHESASAANSPGTGARRPQTISSEGSRENECNSKRKSVGGTWNRHLTSAHNNLFIVVKGCKDRETRYN